MMFHEAKNLSPLEKDRALYALIVATSHYDKLPTKPTDPGPRLLQLDSVATGAYRFAEWLRDSLRNPLHPLGSIRLCLSPSAAELARGIPQTPGGTARAAVEAELKAWREDCLQRDEAMALFFVAGHGLKYGGGEGAVLLQDYDPNGDWLNATLEVERVRDGLGAVGDAEEQLYLADACRAQLPAGFALKGQGLGFGAAESTGIARAPVFFSAASGAYALTNSDSTVFAHALLRCLQGQALDAHSGNVPWRVSTTSLQTGLERMVRSLTENAQWPRVKDTASFCIHEHEDAPMIDYGIRTEPEAAERQAKASLWTNDRGARLFKKVPFAGRPLVWRLQVGDYELDVEPSPPYQPKSLACPVHPDCDPCIVSVV